ncbi:MAG: cytochrome c [Armatimonadetes bacterium]|nr:cytochrome c [Armatimonadota bacterium]
MLRSSLLRAFLAWLLFFACLRLVQPPIPESGIVLYMSIASLAILVYLASDDERVRSIASAGIRFARAKECAGIRVALFLVLSPPYESRQIHVSPPANILVGGKLVKYEEVVNPYRRLENEKPLLFQDHVERGKAVYFLHCFMCHGAKLDGRGMFSEAFHPPPLAFSGQDTIAQMEEAYVFWRIQTGGAGLPPVATPWHSAMPAWEHELTEKEIWQVILYLYRATGNRPQVVR